MIKYIVNTPKGGVGKTTVSTNLSLLLSSQGERVWALDLADGAMSDMLEASPSFDTEECKIDNRNIETVPKSFSGAQKYDYMVMDTDDYYRYPVSLLEEAKQGWRLIAPIRPEDRLGRNRVPVDLGRLATAAVTVGQSIPFRVVLNRVVPAEDSPTEQKKRIRSRLKQEGIASHLSDHVFPHVKGRVSSYFRDTGFSSALEGVINELG